MLVLAHRGARMEAPENTIEAFTAARTQGADGVELDVHRTADDGLVVLHDGDAAGFGVLAEHALAEVRAVFPSVPVLDEVLDACRGLLVNVEIKNSPGDADHDPTCRASDLVVELLRRRGGTDAVIISSFDLATIDRVRTLGPDLPTGLLSFGLDPFDVLELARSRGHSSIHPDAWTLGPVALEVVARASGFGVDVNTWTVNEPDVMVALADAGIGALITDVPDVALRALGRGPAPPA
ncbi:MAG: glycerophosphodiester phosphodiesterase [Acidimicrobiia bacterium]